MSPVVRLDAVAKTYAGSVHAAVDDITLDIDEGEFFSLLGPSGSGKTSTLRMIAGFETPTAGRILLDGRDVVQLPPYRRDVNTVFQNYALFPHMTVARNVAFPLRMSGVGRAEQQRRVADALGAVHMTGYADRLPHQLSGGQRQRVALARALVGRPRVLLLDEPLGALDLRLREQMQLVLKQLQREVGITFVYVTHDQGEALSMSDRLAVMDAGRVEQVGTPSEVYLRPATRFVASFLGRSNLLPCVVREQDGVPVAACADGITVPVPRGTASGPAELALRYETLDVRPRPSGDGIAVVVDEVVFLGDAVDLVGRAGGTQLVARRPGRQALQIARGDEVRFVVDPAAVVVLRG